MFEFTCELCKKTSISAWSEEDAKKEFDSVFNGTPHHDEETGVLCEECYQKVMKFYRLGKYANNKYKNDE